MKRTWAMVIFCFATGTGFDAQAAHGPIKEVVVHSAASLYLNAEFGIVYSDTGDLPAQLRFLCADSTQADAPLQTCGEVEVKIRTRTYGLSAFWLDYTRKNPLVIRLYVDPSEAKLRDVLGPYVGARAGGGLVLGARGMVMVNFLSGVFATTEQNLLPGSGPDHTGWGVDVGFDLSVPVFEISYEGGDDVERPLANYVQP
jgi:hypothetical protein